MGYLMDLININEVLHFLLPTDKILSVSQVKDTKLNKVYNVFDIQTEKCRYILKKNSDYDELNVYQKFSKDGNFRIPYLINYRVMDNDIWLLLSHSGDQDIRGFHMDEVTSQVAGAIAEIHLFYFNTQIKSYGYYQDILKVVPAKYKEIYKYFLRKIALTPWTLIHNDLLPINILTDFKTVTIIDWEPKYGPYFLDIARLIAHRDNEGVKYMPNDFVFGFIDDYYPLVMETYNIEYSVYKKDVLLGIVFEYIQVLKNYWRVQEFDSIYDLYIIDLEEAIQRFYISSEL